MKQFQNHYLATGFAGGAFALIAALPASGNLLGNSSFETPDASGGDVNNAPGAPWSGFSDPNIRFTSTAVARTGAQSLKMFGPFDFIGGGVGATQLVGATGGQAYEGGIYAYNFSADPIQGNNFGVFKIEFLDASMEFVSNGVDPDDTPLAGFNVFESDPINASSTQDVWTWLGVEATAPAGTAYINAVIVAVQLGDGNDNVVGGSSFWDDASVEAVPEPASLALIGLGAMALVRRRRS